MNTISQILTNPIFLLIVFLIGAVAAIKKVMWFIRSANKNIDKKLREGDFKDKKGNKRDLLNEKLYETIQEVTEEYEDNFGPSKFWDRVKILIMIALVIGMAFYFISSSQEQAKNWVETVCTVIDKKVINNNDWYSASFLLNYQVGSTPHTQWTPERVKTKSSAGPATKELNEYNIGQTYQCWYDTSPPNQIILQRGGHMLYLIFGAMICALVAAFALTFRKTERKVRRSR